MSLSLNNESLFIPWVQVYTLSFCLYDIHTTPYHIPYHIMYPILYHESKSIPGLQVYTLSPLYQVFNSTPWIQVNTMNQSLYHTLRFRKKSNFTSKQIQFQIRTNHISHWNKSHFTFEEIPFHIGTNSISHLNKSPFTLEQILF